MREMSDNRRARKREAILDAATRVFCDEGYATTSMDRIAELAQASKRTVYNHFQSKEALFQAVVDRLFDQLEALKQVTWDPGRPLEDQLADFARVKASIVDDPGWLALIRVMLGVFIRDPELARATLTRAASSEGVLVRWLEAARDAGQLDLPDVDLAASIFWALAGGALFWPQLFEGTMDPERRDQLTRELVATFLARYRAR